MKGQSPSDITHPPDPLPLPREGGVKIREGDTGGEVNKNLKGMGWINK
jgi:hypothetical protein